MTRERAPEDDPGFAFAPRSLMGRMIALTALLMALATGVVLLRGASRLEAAAIDAETARIRAIAATLAPHIDGDAHRRAALELVDRDDVHRWETAPAEVRAMHRLLARVADANELRSPIYTLALRESAIPRVNAARDVRVPDAMVHLVSSSSTPYWRHTSAYRPAMMRALEGQRVVTVPPYSDDIGTWISAYAPIKTEAGEVVAVLEVDAPMDHILERIADHTTQLALFAALVYVLLLCAMVLLSVGLTASTSRLAAAARAFGKGDYTTPITPAGPLETRELGWALEGARRKLARYLMDRRRIEAQLAATAQKAEEATRVKSLFLANMSHELRTPLNAIMGYSEMLIEDAEDAGQDAMVPDLEKIRGAGKHLLTLINDILDISKIEAGRMELFVEDFEVRELVNEVLGTMRPLIERGNNQLSFEIDPALDTMRADLTRVKQILVNLLGNAAKFTESGVIALSLALDDDPSFVRIEVRDTGIGMSPEQRARLFHAFSQADPSTTRKFGGTGLGLALCQQFAVMMGGDITCESELGVGSTFCVRLPRKSEVC